MRGPKIKNDKVDEKNCDSCHKNSQDLDEGFDNVKDKKKKKKKSFGNYIPQNSNIINFFWNYVHRENYFNGYDK